MHTHIQSKGQSILQGCYDNNKEPEAHEYRLLAAPTSSSSELTRDRAIMFELSCPNMFSLVVLLWINALWGIESPKPQSFHRIDGCLVRKVSRTLHTIHRHVSASDPKLYSSFLHFVGTASRCEAPADSEMALFESSDYLNEENSIET